MVRVAIVGSGAAARSHAAAYAAHRGRCAVVAVASPRPGAAAAFAAELGLEAEALRGHEGLLGRGDVDLVSVCAPPSAHAAIASDLLRDGKHVLLEKPMAPSPEDCRRLVEIAASGPAILSPVAQNRFRASYWRLKGLLDSGLAGRPLFAQVDSLWWRGDSYYARPWRGRWEEEGGGCTLGHAVHHIDLLLWMMGMPIRATAVMANVAHPSSEMEDISVAVLEFESGAIAQLTSSIAHHGEEQRIVFQCEKASLSAPFRVFARVEGPGGFPAGAPDLEAGLSRAYESIDPPRFEGLEGQVDDLLSAIEAGRRPLVGPEDGRDAVQVVAGIYASACSGRTVALPLRPGDDFYDDRSRSARAPRMGRARSGPPGRRS
jgi:predicted dehydrogenase